MEKKEIYILYINICKLYRSFVQASTSLFAPPFPLLSLDSQSNSLKLYP